MINLTGSEKQINWANEIRDYNIKALENERNTFQQRIKEEGSDFTNIVNEFDRIIDKLSNQQPSAKWWIEHKEVWRYCRQQIIERA